MYLYLRLLILKSTVSVSTVHTRWRVRLHSPAFNWTLMTRVVPNSKKFRLQSLRLTFLKRMCSRTCWWVFYSWHQVTRTSQNPFMSTLVSNTPKCEDTKFYSQQHKIQFYLGRFRSMWNELQLLLSTPQFIRDFPVGPQQIYIERKQVVEGKKKWQI